MSKPEISTSTHAPEVSATPAPELTERQQAIALWMAADTIEKKRAALQKFPALSQMYDQARNLT